MSYINIIPASHGELVLKIVVTRDGKHIDCQYIPVIGYRLNFEDESSQAHPLTISGAERIDAHFVNSLHEGRPEIHISLLYDPRRKGVWTGSDWRDCDIPISPDWADHDFSSILAWAKGRAAFHKLKSDKDAEATATAPQSS